MRSGLFFLTKPSLHLSHTLCLDYVSKIIHIQIVSIASVATSVAQGDKFIIIFSMEQMLSIAASVQLARVFI